VILLTSACIGAHDGGANTEKMLPGSKSVDTFPFLREADGSQSPIREAYHSGNFQSAVIRRDAAGVGGAREGIRSSELTPLLPSA